MAVKVGALQPLDAVISGCAYENATTAIGVLEEGQATRKWISTEMLCTLDNFIKVALFNERIFVTGCADLEDNYFIPRDVRYGAGKAGQRLFDDAKIFVTPYLGEGDSKAAEDRLAEVLPPAAPLFTIRCDWPEKQRAISQEMVYLDAFFIEYAIAQFGAERFKPVFPGEQLYLGLRQRRLAAPRATHTMADLPGRRLRAVVRDRMKKLNAFVAQGAPLLPELPPIFVSRILHDCVKGYDFVATLLEIRNSPALVRFRKWMIKCHELSQSTDLAQRTKAAEALAKLDAFLPDDGVSAKELSFTFIKLAKLIQYVPTFDVAGVVDDWLPPVMNYLGGVPLSGLRQFGARTADPGKLDAFLTESFGDKFNRNDMESIANLLELPDDLADWAKEAAEFSVRGERLDAMAPPLSRPYSIQAKGVVAAEGAMKDFEEMWQRGEKVTPELLRKWEEESRKPK